MDGLRLSKTVDGKTTKHVWDGNQQLVADVLDSELYSANCYLRGTNLVATYSYQNGEKSGYTYYTQNAHGDVVNLTDATGAISKSYTYDAFGVEKNIDDSDTNAFRYCGEYYDAETGTIYLRARYYDPSMGRFISRDSFAGENNDPLSLNLYTYCKGNPISLKDSSGHWFGLDDAIAAGIGAIAGGVGQLASDLAHSAITGELKFSDWQTYTGSILGGAVGGVCSLYVSPAVGSAIASGTSTLLGQTLQYATGAEEAPEKMSDILLNTAQSFVIGGLMSKIPHVSSKHPTIYSANSVYNSGMNKLGNLYCRTSSVRDTVKTVFTNSLWKETTKKTVSNGIIDQSVSSAEESVYDTARSIIWDWMNVKGDAREATRETFRACVHRRFKSVAA